MTVKDLIERLGIFGEHLEVLVWTGPLEREDHIPIADVLYDNAMAAEQYPQDILTVGVSEASTLAGDASDQSTVRLNHSSRGAAYTVPTNILFP